MGPRDRPEVRQEVRREYSISSSSSGTPESSSRKRTDSGKGNALERLFKKRYRGKRTPPEERQSIVPDIVVESPVGYSDMYIFSLIYTDSILVNACFFSKIQPVDSYSSRTSRLSQS